MVLPGETEPPEGMIPEEVADHPWLAEMALSRTGGRFAREEPVETSPEAVSPVWVDMGGEAAGAHGL